MFPVLADAVLAAMAVIVKTIARSLVWFVMRVMGVFLCALLGSG
jgi:hypothetical protein